MPTVTAALVTGRETLELRELPAPEAGPGRAVVEVAYCGICGTDLHAYQHGTPYNPATCGHEWSGAVAALGDGVAHLREGDRVGIGVPTACGDCGECRRGASGQCRRVLEAMLGLGRYGGPHGGFARALCVDAGRLYRLHPDVGDEDAALLEPAAVAVHALRRRPLRLGESAAIVGAGPIGLLVLQAATAAGAGERLVVEPDPRRAALAAELGATRVLDPRADDFDDAWRAAAGPVGADVVFECAGRPETIDGSVGLARRGGCVALVGMASVPAEIQPARWLGREIELVASLGYVREDFDVAQALAVDGRLRLAPLRSGVVPLAQIEPAFRRLLDGGDGAVKLLVDPRLD